MAGLYKRWSVDKKTGQKVKKFWYITTDWKEVLPDGTIIKHKKFITTQERSRKLAEEARDRWKDTGSIHGNPKADKEFNIFYFEDMKREVLKFYKLNYPDTHDLYKTTFIHFQKLIDQKIIKNKPLAQYDLNDIETFKAHRLNDINPSGEPISRNTINKDIRNLRSAFTRMVANKVLQENPIGKVTMLKIFKEKKIRIFSAAEEQMIFANIKQPSVYKAAMLSLHTGMRLDEVLHAQLKDVNFKEGYISVNHKSDLGYHQKTTASVRLIPLSEKLLELIPKWFNIDVKSNIHSLVHPESLFCPTQKNTIYGKSSFSRMFSDVLKPLKISGSFHSLRHTFATRLLNNGVGLETVRSLLGHTYIFTTSGYLHSVNEDKIKAISSIK
ncbi:site-specific integrase [soil metagenome]